MHHCLSSLNFKRPLALCLWHGCFALQWWVRYEACNLTCGDVMFLSSQRHLHILTSCYFSNFINFISLILQTSTNTYAYIFSFLSFADSALFSFTYFPTVNPPHSFKPNSNFTYTNILFLIHPFFSNWPVSIHSMESYNPEKCERLSTCRHQVLWKKKVKHGAPMKKILRKETKKKRINKKR